MYVKDYMTADPYCIKPDTSVSKALDIMEQNDFHRLPVVDDENHLIGLVTEGLISESSGSSTTSLSIYELNYLLSRTKVSEIMIREVRTISSEALLEEAAEKMTSEHINVLPIIDDDRRVIGIITENDIFQAFIDLLGYRAEGTRFVFSVTDDRPGLMENVCAAFAKENINILNLGVYHNKRGIEVVVLVAGDCAHMKEKLEAEGWKIADVRRQEGRKPL
ncbi:MAG: CBS domain-containing protein [Solobacterium sp.]|nr:CBS domain-containing protein [Solobacterium sp.]